MTDFLFLEERKLLGEKISGFSFFKFSQIEFLFLLSGETERKGEAYKPRRLIKQTCN